MPQSLVCLAAHFVFSTKGREPLILPGWAGRLYDYIGGVVHAEKCQSLAAGGVPDHVHLLVSVGRTVSLADLMRMVKTNSSKWVHETLPDAPFNWQAGYGGFDVSHDHLGTIRQYIARQAEHHAGRSYQDEYRAILREHGLEWDERYVWD
ncbi:MAG: IS200/IS605 family transposase [Gemmataceae bacterium]